MSLAVGRVADGVRASERISMAFRKFLYCSNLITQFGRHAVEVIYVDVR
jgi:hypothetical protein